MKQIEITMPNKEGEYLFYFGYAKRPFYAVDTFRFTVDEDEYETNDFYLEEYNQYEVSMWWELPIPNYPLPTSERHWL
jgi:hypothetical protein